MAKLKNGIPFQIVHQGDYQLTYTIGTGTAKLQQSVDGKSFQDIPQSDVSISTAVIASLATSIVKAVLTGDAELSINSVRV